METINNTDAIMDSIIVKIMGNSTATAGSHNEPRLAKSINKMPDPDKKEFLKFIAGKTPEGTGHVFCVQSKAPGDSVPWPPITRDQMFNKLKDDRVQGAYYMSTQVSTLDERGSPRNQIATFYSLTMIVLDDIGTKVEGNQLQPTYIIETSEGNFQWGYVFDNPVTDAAVATALVKSVYASGITDKGGNLTGKYVRLPLGVNGKVIDGRRNLFKVELREFNADIVYTPDELAEGLGVSGEFQNYLAQGYIPHTAKDKPDHEIFSAIPVHGSIQSNGAYEITCPWSEKHSEGTGTTAGLFIHDNDSVGFSCFHDHCAGRTIDDVIEQLKKSNPEFDDSFQYPSDSSDCVDVSELRAGTDIPTALTPVGDCQFDSNITTPPSIKTRGGQLLDSIVTLSSGGYYDLYLKESFANAKTLNAYYGHLKIKVIGSNGMRGLSPEKQLENSPKKMVARGLCWQPVRAIHYKPIVQFDGHLMVNTFSPPDITPEKGDVSMWIKLVGHICGKYADLVLDHMAFTVQFPEQKIRWQVLIVGEPRTGKTSIFEPLVNMLGAMANTISNEALQNDWGNTFAKRKVLLVEEVYGFDGRTFNQLKPKFANSNIEELNMKGAAPIYQQNLYSMYMLTNHMDAFKMSPDEDKLLVINAPDYKIFGDSAASKNFYDQFGVLKENKKHLQACLDYLLNRDISNFSHGALPVRTTALHDMCDASKADYVHFIEDLITAKERPFDVGAVLMEDIKSVLSMHKYGGGDKGISAALKDLGWVKVQGQKKVSGKNRTTKRFWAESAVVSGKTARELHEFYMENPKR